MILYCLISSFLNAVTSLVLGGVIASKKPRDARTITFTFVTLSIAIWSAFYFLWQIAPNAVEALRYVHLFSAAAILIPILYFHFVTKLTDRPHSRELLVGYILVAPLLPLSFTSLIVTGVRSRMMFRFWPEPGVLYPAYLGLFFYFLIRSWRLLYQEYRQSSFLRRNQLRYVLAYTVLGFAGGATNFLLWYGILIPPVGNILVGVYMLGVGYAVVRFRLMEFDLLVARIVTYGLLIGLLAALVPGLIEVISRAVPGGVEPGDPMLLFLVSLAVTAALFRLIPSIRRRIDAALEQRVLGDRLPDRGRLRSLISRISSAEDEAALYQEVVAGVGDALDVAKVSIYTRTEFETDFTRRATSPNWTGSAQQFADDSPVAKALQGSGRSLLVAETEHDAAGELRAHFVELRRVQGIELVVPVIGDTFFYGFIAFGPRMGHALYTSVDVSLLEAIGLQVGLSLRARQLERRASQTEKLISLGTLAAGLAHELRNPLVSIQTFSSLMKERGMDVDFQQEFGAVVQRDVNRIASIVENVSAFAESNKVDMMAVDLSEVLRTVAEIVRPELVRTGIPLDLPDRSVPLIRGNHSQLLQVFLNLIQNALQALEGRTGARLTLGYETHLNDLAIPLVCVTVEDNGPGIDSALQPHIFDPFTTTKATGERRGKHGMGLGLAIVKRIVQYHRGEINVSSTPGRGTVFRVYLPQFS